MSQPSFSMSHGLEAMPSALSSSTAQLPELERLHMPLDEHQAIKQEEGELRPRVPFILAYDPKTEGERNAAASRGDVLVTTTEARKQLFRVRDEIPTIHPPSSSQSTRAITARIPLRKRTNAAQSLIPIIYGGRGTVRVSSMNCPRRSIEGAVEPAPKRQRLDEDLSAASPSGTSPSPESPQMQLPQAQLESLNPSQSQQAKSEPPDTDLAAKYASLQAEMAALKARIQLQTPPNSQPLEPLEEQSLETITESEKDFECSDPLEHQAETPPTSQPLAHVEETRDQSPFIETEEEIQPSTETQVPDRDTSPEAEFRYKPYTWDSMYSGGEDDDMVPINHSPPAPPSREGSSGISEVCFQEPPPTAKCRLHMRRHSLDVGKLRKVLRHVGALRRMDPSSSEDESESDSEEQSSHFQHIEVVQDHARSPTVHLMPEVPEEEPVEELPSAQHPTERASSLDRVLQGKPYGVVLRAYSGFTAVNRPKRKVPSPPAQPVAKKVRTPSTRKKTSREKEQDAPVTAGRRQKQRSVPLAESSPMPAAPQPKPKHLFGATQAREMSRFPSIAPEAQVLQATQPEIAPVPAPQPTSNLAQTISTAGHAVSAPATASTPTVPIKKPRGRPRKTPVVPPQESAVATPAPIEEPLPTTTIAQPPSERQPSQAPSQGSDSSDDLPTLEDVFRRAAAQKASEAAAAAAEPSSTTKDEPATSSAPQSPKGKGIDYNLHPLRGAPTGQLAEPFVLEVDEVAAQAVNVAEGSSTAAGPQPDQSLAALERAEKNNNRRGKKSKRAKEDDNRLSALAPTEVSPLPAIVPAQKEEPMSQGLVVQEPSTATLTLAATVSASNPGIKMQAAKTAKKKLNPATERRFQESAERIAAQKAREQRSESEAAAAQVYQEGRRKQSCSVAEIEMANLAKLRQQEADEKLADSAAAAALRANRHRVVTAGPECNMPPPPAPNRSTTPAPGHPANKPMTPWRWYGREDPNARPKSRDNHIPSDTPEAETPWPSVGGTPTKEETRTIILLSEESQEEEQKVQPPQAEQTNFTAPPVVPAALAAPTPTEAETRTIIASSEEPEEQEKVQPTQAAQTNSTAAPIIPVALAAPPPPPTQLPHREADPEIVHDICRLGMDNAPRLAGLMAQGTRIIEETKDRIMPERPPASSLQTFSSLSDSSIIIEMWKLGRNDRPMLVEILRLCGQVLG